MRFLSKAGQEYHLFNARLAFFTKTMDACSELKEFPHIHIMIQGIGLGQVAYALTHLQRLSFHIMTANGYFARRRRQVAGNDLHCSGFPCSVGAKEAYY